MSCDLGIWNIRKMSDLFQGLKKIIYISLKPLSIKNYDYTILHDIF